MEDKKPYDVGPIVPDRAWRASLTEAQWRRRHRTWHQQPATEAQKEKLRSLGVIFPLDITLAEARDAIGRRDSRSGNICLVNERSLAKRSF